MQRDLIINLIYNISILLTLALIYASFQGHQKSIGTSFRILVGLMVGLSGILLIASSVQLDNGVIFDARSILISVAAMFFGPLPTVIAGAILIAYRLMIGGPGVYMGILVVLSSAAIGMIWHRFRFARIASKGAPFTGEFYVFGILVHIAMLLCALALPEGQFEATLRSILWPVLLLYPAGTYILCTIFMNQFEKNRLIEQLTQSEFKYRHIANNTSDVIWTTDLDFHLTYVSPSVERLFGEPAERYMARSMAEKFPGPDLALLMRGLRDELEKDHLPGIDKGRTKFVEVRHYKADGSVIWVSMHVSFIRDEQGRIIGYQGIYRDITELKRISEERSQSANLIVSLIDSIPDLIFFKDVRGVYIGCNSTFASLVGKSKESVPGSTDHDLFDHDLADFFRSHDEIILQEREPRHIEEWVTYPDGRRALLDTLKTPYLDANGDLIGILGISRDITERKQKEEEICHIAYHDHLTGLYNRRFYEEELHRLDVPRNLPLTIALGDVNGLKLVNDSFGHPVGDELLIKVADMLRTCCRADDIIARYGGDEFIILLPRTTAEEADRIIGRIHDLSASETINGIDVSISFGSETKTRESESIDDILKNTEDRMYRHKLFEGASMRSRTIDVIMNTLYEKNNREMQHSKRVSKLCGDIAAAMDLGKYAVEQIKLAGLVHDIGKIGIDENILNSPRRLTPDEWIEMQKHSEIGYRILSSANEFSEIAEYVLQHQEKWDGSGYPKGLKGPDISQEARIIALADAYDAMTGVRTYGRVLPAEEAIEEIRRCAGTHFDPVIAHVFIDRVLLKA